METGLHNSRTSNALKSKLAENKLPATSVVKVSKRKRITTAVNGAIIHRDWFQQII